MPSGLSRDHYNEIRPMTMTNWITVKAPGQAEKVIRMYLGGRGSLELCQPYNIRTLIDCRGADLGDRAAWAQQQPWCSEEGYSTASICTPTRCTASMHSAVLRPSYAQCSTVLYCSASAFSCDEQYSTVQCWFLVLRARSHIQVNVQYVRYSTYLRSDVQYENMDALYLNCSCIIAIDIIGTSRLINIIANHHRRLH